MINEGGKNMKIKRILVNKILVIGTLLLLFGIAVQPGTATFQPKDIHIEPKEFLFQTIIDIANNPDVKILIEQEKKNGVFLDFNLYYRNIYRKLLFRNPNLLHLLILTKPSITHEYLNIAYNQGCDLINELGEDRALEIIDSITITNPNFSNKLSNIIKNNDDLNYKINEIKAINCELNPYLPFKDHPIICAILLILLFTVMIPFVSIFGLIVLLSNFLILGPIFFSLFLASIAIVGIFLELIALVCF